MKQLIVRSYEKQGHRLVLVLEHTFFGKTKAEALHYSASHSKTDDFYRETGGHIAAKHAMKEPNGTIVHGHFRDIVTVTEALFRKSGQ